MKKKVFSMLLVIALVAGMAVGCTSATETKKETKKTEGKSDGKYKIVVMPKLIGIPYFTETGKGAEKAGEELGVEVIYNGPTTADATEQVKMLEDYISQGVDAICVAPNDPAALEPVLKKAKEAGIKVLDWDTPANPDLVDASVRQISDQELGEHLVDKMVEYMGTEKGDWAIITGGLSAANLNAWIKYGREYAEKEYPDLNLVADPYPTDEKQDVALSTTKDILKAYPDVKGLFCVSTPSPIGAGLAIRELGMQDKVTVVGTSVEADVKDLLTDGAIDCGSLWNCEDLGYLTVGTAKALLDGKELKDGMEIEGFGKIKLEDNLNVIMGPPEDYEKK